MIGFFTLGQANLQQRRGSCFDYELIALTCRKRLHVSFVSSDLIQPGPTLLDFTFGFLQIFLPLHLLLLQF